MRANYLAQLISRPGKTRSHEGGEVFVITPQERLRRFLILGTVGGTFYAGEQTFTEETLAAVKAAIEAEPERSMALAREISRNGEAVSNEPAVVAVALAMASDDLRARKAAYAVYPDVIRTGGDHLRAFEYLVGMRHSSAGFRRTLGEWYTSKSDHALAYQLLKYQRRGTASHRRVLRMARPTPKSEVQSELLRMAVHGFVPIAGEPLPGGLPKLVEGFIAAHAAPAEIAPPAAAEIVRDYRLTWEMTPSAWLRMPDVWMALLESMPMNAMLRNLGQLGKHGLLEIGGAGTALVIDRIGDAEAIRASRLHPISILKALRVYGQGRGVRGRDIWTPNSRVVAALDAAFLTAFGNVEPVGGVQVVALDVSGSMSWAYGVAGVMDIFTPAEAAGAMAMVAARTEPEAYILPFDVDYRRDIVITGRDSLDDVMRKIRERPGGGTLTSSILRHLLQNRIAASGLTIYTDNEAADSETHDLARILNGRHGTRAAAVGTTATERSVFDSNAPYVFNAVGFDASTPRVVAHFLAGKV